MKQKILSFALLFVSFIPEILAIETDTAFTNICSSTHFLPENKIRASYVNLIGQFPDKSIFFSEKFSKTGLSVLKDNKWTYIDKSNYLPSNNIQSSYKDKNKNIWFGTDSGAVKYDGQTWTIYKFNDSKQDIYPIIDIVEGKNGEIRFITYYFIYKLENGLLKKDVNFLNFGSIISAASDINGNIWLATQKGLVKYDGTNYIQITYTYSQLVACLDDTIYYSTNTSPDTLKKVIGNTSVKFATLTSGYYSSISEDLNHNIYAITDGALYVIKKYSNGECTDIPMYNYDIYNCTKTFVDSDNNLWVAGNNTNPKIVKISSNGDVTKFKNNLDKGIFFQNAFDPLIDKKQNLWVRTWNDGYSKFDGKKWTTYLRDSLSFFWLNSTGSHVLGPNGTIYCAGNKISYYDSIWKSPNISDTYISSIDFDQNNKMWYNSWLDNGEYIIKSYDGITFKEYTKNNGVIQHEAIKIIHDLNNYIWVIYRSYDNDNAYINRYNGTKWDTIKLFDSSINYAIYDIEADSTGNVWFATSEGLVKYNDASGITKYNILNSNIPKNNIANILVKNDMIWATFDEKYIAYFKNGKFKKLDLSNYIETQTYGRIAIDNKNNLYVGISNCGLLKLKFSLDTLELVKSDATCANDTNGKIIFLPKKDLTYFYSIDEKTFQKDSTFNVSGGIYNVKIRQGNCFSSPKTVTINQPSGTMNFAVKSTSCYNKTDGSISIISSGIDNIKYNWNDNSDSSALINLGKGSYSVNIKYANCDMKKTFEIKEPDPLTIKGKILNDCGKYNGKIEISISGGTTPYKLKWNTGDSSTTIKNLAAGSYTLNLEDSAKCEKRDTTFVVSSHNEIPVRDIINNSKAYICNDSLKINIKTSFTDYKWWKNGENLNTNEESIYATANGLYKVGVSNSNNCYAEDSILLTKKRNYSIPEICLITVDEQTNKNKLVWNYNKNWADSTVHYNILKETTQSNVYEKIGDIPMYYSGFYTDENSNPNVKAERYRLTLKDECEVESDSSAIHKTIHLTSNIGINGEVNLIWSGYEGFNFGTYNIYRGSSKDNMTLLFSIQSNLNSYTDESPITGNNSYYQLEVINEAGCTPNKLKSTTNSSRSNVVNINKTNVNSITNNNSLVVSPNPVFENMKINIDNPNNESLELKIFDITGKVYLVKNGLTGNSFTESREGLSAGTYILALKGKTVNSKAILILK